MNIYHNVQEQWYQPEVLYAFTVRPEKELQGSHKVF